MLTSGGGGGVISNVGDGFGGGADAREEALSELKAIEAEMGQYADNDPTTFEAMKEVVKVAHEASNK
ncbi:hypothetical protein QVD17_21193 [Tagetes erecta]|uniref:Uncharacterized protein n=1 Tax=Tagetes erecta TaxID=13708 RepID=A0AAD8KT29_TARER|nr:hypothetical protein QVD17_21193 [Tagetes erecta]